MNLRAEIELDSLRTARGSGSLRPNFVGWPLRFCAAVLVFCAVAVVSQLLYVETLISSEQRQQAFEALGVYP